MAAHVARLGIVPGLFCGGGIHGRIVYSGRVWRVQIQPRPYNPLFEYRILSFSAINSRCKLEYRILFLRLPGIDDCHYHTLA